MLLAAALCTGCGLSGATIRKIEPKADKAREKHRKRQEALRDDYRTMTARFIACTAVVDAISLRLAELFTGDRRTEILARIEEGLRRAELPPELLSPRALPPERLAELLDHRTDWAHVLGTVFNDAFTESLIADPALQELRAMTASLSSCSREPQKVPNTGAEGPSP